MKKCWFVWAFLAVALGACSTLRADDLPTPYPTEYLPTVIALTVDAARQATPSESVAVLRPSAVSSPARTITASPTAFPTPSASPTLEVTPIAKSTPTPTPTSGAKIVSTTTRRPTRTKTVTPTPTLPLAAVQIYDPGPMSKLVSPIVVRAALRPASSNRVRIELLGEDGQLLVRKILRYDALSGSVVTVSTELDFEIAAVAEAARLVVSTDDSYGRIVALASVDVVLLSIGENDLNPAGDLREPVVIREPLPNTLIQGDVLVVVGRAKPTTSGGLLVELVDAKGKVVGYRQAVVGVPDEMGYGTFTVDVPYEVTGPTWVRLTVSDIGDRPKGLKHVTSLEVLLSP